MNKLIIKNIKNDVDAYWRVFTLFILTLLVTLVPDASYAFAGFENALCAAFRALSGTPAKVIATFGLIFLGIGAFFGKLNWGTALLFGVGIITIFAAKSIVEGLGGTGATGICAAPAGP